MLASSNATWPDSHAGGPPAFFIRELDAAAQDLLLTRAIAPICQAPLGDPSSGTMICMSLRLLSAVCLAARWQSVGTALYLAMNNKLATPVALGSILIGIPVGGFSIVPVHRLLQPQRARDWKRSLSGMAY